MDFIEEKTPQGYMIKILFLKWQFLAFNRRGKPIYADQEGRSLVHKVPLIVFVGSTIQKIREYDRDYSMLKIRDGVIVVPYRDVRDNRKKYFFISTDEVLDMIPVRIISSGSIIEMIREVDVTLEPDYVVVDDNITTNDIVLIKGRYKVRDIIYIELVNNYFLNERMITPPEEKMSNINMMSSNPVFLAQVHLRNMDLAKLNQLLLDFEIPAIDIEFIVNFIETVLEDAPNNASIAPNQRMLEEMRDSFKFYLFLLQKSDGDIREMINSRKDVKTLAPFRTLVSKVKSLYPGKEDQLLYTDYENLLMERREDLIKSKV
ncbi:MAG: hypothetical protein JXA20_10450 [Spirochaetes bacterium]|nr:hypothetical protein [Spirochaetota bacterium]